MAEGLVTRLMSVSKWFSPRAIVIHLLLLAWLGGCVAASIWQVGRAIQGNSLSFLYSIEWPLFTVLGILGWWALLHLDTISDNQIKARADFEALQRQRAAEERARAAKETDPEVAAYNAHLERISQGPKKKMWGH